jgi:hypothetical protein
MVASFVTIISRRLSVGGPEEAKAANEMCPHSLCHAFMVMARDSASLLQEACDSPRVHIQVMFDHTAEKYERLPIRRINPR